ncbi:MAG: hypothetical protein IT462_08990 [Planctomycetes bacterium]|nr:hypothetical protein [Planctomycetota bacterium]
MSAKTRVFALSVSKLPRRKRNKIAAMLKRLAGACVRWLVGGVPGTVGYRLAQIAVGCGLAAAVAGGIAGPAVHAGGPTSYVVNQFASNNQTAVAVAADADGDNVIVWQSYAQDGVGEGIYARRYNANGDASGPEFRVHTETSGNQYAPDVAMDADGDFVVVWRGYGHSASDSSLYDFDAIWGQRFNFEGAPMGEQFYVGGGDTSDGLSAPSVAMDADGNFVVAWHRWVNSAVDGQVFFRRFDAGGAGAAEQFIADAGYDYYPDVAMAADGRFVIAWQIGNGGDYDVLAQRYNAAGVAQGTPISVNDPSTDNQSQPAVAMDVDGDFVVAFTNGYLFVYSYTSISSPYSTNYYSYYTNNVQFKRFDAVGAPQGVQTQASPPSFYPMIQDSHRPSVSMDADGDFVIAFDNEYYYYSSPYFSGFRVMVETFNAGGASTGSTTLDTTGNTFQTGYPSVAVDADGDYVTGWHGQVSSTWDVKARNLALNHSGGAAPWIAGVYVPNDGHRVTQGETLTQNISRLLVTFSEQMDQALVEDVTNWSLTHNGAPVAILGVTSMFNFTRYRYEATLDFGDTALEDGDYVLTATDNLLDVPFGNALDGNFDGIQDGNFVTDFTVSRQQKVGGEFMVHAAASSTDQENPDVAMDADGNFVVVWQSYSPPFGYNVFARLYNAQGVAQGAEFQVNTLSFGFQGDPAVAMDADGDFVVVWSGVLSSYATSSSDNNIVMQLFNSSGAPVGSNTPVHMEMPSGGTPGYVADVAMDATGNFIVAWEGPTSGFFSNGIIARRYNDDGTPMGAEFAVTSSGFSYGFGRPSVAMDADGDFVIAYHGYQPGGFPFPGGNRIFAARGDRDGAIRENTSITTITELFAGEQFAPSVAMDADGDFVIAYTHVYYSYPNYETEVHLRTFDGQIGSGLVAETIVVSDPNGNSSDAAVAMDDDGDFVVAWEQNPNDYFPAGSDVMARRYNWLGVAQTLPFNMATDTPRAEWDPAVAMDADGEFVGAWEAFYSSSSTSTFAVQGNGPRAPSGDLDVWAQRFAPFGTPTVIGGGIADFSVDEDDAPTVIDLSTIFASTDPDVIYNVSANDNPTLVNAIADGSGNLTLTYLPDQNGAAVISVRATNAGGDFIEDSFTVTVNAVNDAPVLDVSASPQIVALRGAAPIPYEIGDVVRALITDVDTGALEGVAITSASGDGQWQYSTDGGTNWTDFPAGIAESAALLLDDDNDVRFVPDAGAAGTATLLYRAWDQSDAGTPGTQVDASVNGGTTAFSDDDDTITVQIYDATDVINNIKNGDDDGCAATVSGNGAWGLLAMISLLLGGFFTRRRKEADGR